MHKPYFCLSSDLDWASEYALADFMDILKQYNIKPTIFATHQSKLLTEYDNNGQVEIGLHPNYLPGSTHGEDIAGVTQHITTLFPKAKAYRSHHFFNCAGVEFEMMKHHVYFDSNINLYLQPNIVPLRRFSGISSFPVFWEDDVHWLNQGQWSFDHYINHFLTSGLKILNLHPFFVAANIPTQEYYQEIKGQLRHLSADNINQIRYQGQGTRTFLIRMLDVLKAQGHTFYTLGDLCTLFPIEPVDHKGKCP